METYGKSWWRKIFKLLGITWRRHRARPAAWRRALAASLGIFCHSTLQYIHVQQSLGIFDGLAESGFPIRRNPEFLRCGRWSVGIMNRSHAPQTGNNYTGNNYQSDRHARFPFRTRTLIVGRPCPVKPKERDLVSSFYFAALSNRMATSLQFTTFQKAST